eukprot:COSAG04_NODE_29807_length_266_cov_1.029940_1_plen_78_part_10
MAPMVDRELFLRQGYLILDIIPQQLLPAVRDAFEELAWRQRDGGRVGHNRSAALHPGPARCLRCADGRRARAGRGRRR